MINAGKTRAAALCIALAVTLVASAAPAAGQTSVGSGPLTSTLADTEPVSGVLSMGPVKVAPGVVVREIGWDSNVFGDNEDPKEDFVTSIKPDVSIFSRLRFLKLSAYAGTDLSYYRTYESERSVGHDVRGRADLLLSRLRPFVGAARTVNRTRPNGEIDGRADRAERELSGGVAFDLSANSLTFVSASRTATEFEDSFEEGVDLRQSLNRESHDYQAGIKTDLTPLLSLTLAAGYREDTFDLDPLRNSDSRTATAGFRFSPDAIVSGAINLSYRDFTPVDPGIAPFRGFAGTVAMAYPFLEVGRLNVGATRGIEYSFDVEQAYYLENTINVGLTYRFVGAIDGQVVGARSSFEYDARAGLPARTDRLDMVGGSLGYNLRNRTRIALNYESQRRRSPEVPRRNQERQRVYVSWAYAF
jgi:hypothetical protein